MQGFVEHFKNLKPKPTRVGNHVHIKVEDLYHKKVRIPNRLREHI
jgi:hypothetical protein